MQKSPTLFSRYVSHPLRLIFRNSSVLILFAIALLVDLLGGNGDPIPLKTLGAWIFEALPKIALHAASSPILLGSFIVLFLVKCFISVWVAMGMMHTFQRKRDGFFGILVSISVAHFTWYLGCLFLIYLVFIPFVSAVYLVAYFSYFRTGYDSSYGLLIFLALLYPVFYVCMSTGSMISVMPFTSRERIRKLRCLLLSKAMWSLYLFYSVRIFLELILLFAVPLFCLDFFNSRPLAMLSVLFALVVPFALFRGSAYELKLRLLQHDNDVRAVFPDHFIDFTE